MKLLCFLSDRFHVFGMLMSRDIRLKMFQQVSKGIIRRQETVVQPTKSIPIFCRNSCGLLDQ